MTLANIAFLVVLGFTGLGFILAGLAFVWFNWRFVAAAVRTSGEVVDYKPETVESTRDGCPVQSVVLYPVVEFRDAQGVQRRARTSCASSPPPFHAGVRVPVLYDPANPARAEIAAFGQLWLVPAILLGLGVAQVSVAIAFALSGRNLFA